MKNVFIFGYYGFQNTGDEAILQVIVDQIRENISDANISVLSYNAKETMEKYNIKSVSRNKYMDLIKAIKEADIVVSGGGSILQDATSVRSLIYYLSIIYIAKKMGKKVMFYGNGFGPITKTFNKKLVQYVINKVDVITVRDIQSKEEMISLGIKKDITVTADVTFAYKNVPDSGFAEEKQSKKKIGISVRDWKDEERYKSAVAGAGDYLIQKGYEVIFVPMQHPRDYIVSEEIASIMEGNPEILENKYTIKELIHIMSGFHMMIGMRLHSLIFGAIAGIPILGIEYDAKIYNFLQIVGQENGGKLEELEEESLIKAIDQVLDHYDLYAERIKIGRDILQKKSEENIFILKRFMEKGGSI